MDVGTPQCLVERFEGAHWGAVDADDAVTRAQPGVFGGAVTADADHAHGAALLDAIHAQPGARTAARRAVPAQFRKDRFEQIDRNKHVAAEARVVVAQRVGNHQRADAQEFAFRIEQARAAVVRAWGCGEQRAVNVIFPIPRKRASRRQAREAALTVFAAAADHQRFAFRHGGRTAEPGRTDF